LGKKILDGEAKERINRRIAESHKKYSPKEQLAALLIRNNQFLKEWWRIESIGDNVVIPWGRFCDRWKINQLWNGSLHNLSEFVRVEPGLIYDPLHAWPLTNGFELVPFPPDRPDYLYIKIEPWTNVDDIQWKRIKELKKAIFGYIDQEKNSFEKAICWYDLHNQEKLGYGQIAEIWIEKEARYIEDKESFKITIREGIKRIKRYIQRLTPPANN